LLGIDFDSYITDSIYEIEDLDLRKKIIPPQTSYTLSDGSNTGGAPTDNSNKNENTVKSKTSGSNNTPKPSK
jgi:hypothetical protein